MSKGKSPEEKTDKVNCFILQLKQTFRRCGVDITTAGKTHKLSSANKNPVNF